MKERKREVQRAREGERVKQRGDTHTELGGSGRNWGKGTQNENLLYAQNIFQK